MKEKKIESHLPTESVHLTDKKMYQYFFKSCFVDILLLSWSRKVNLVQVTTHFMDDFRVACDTYRKAHFEPLKVLQ